MFGNAPVPFGTRSEAAGSGNRRFIDAARHGTALVKGRSTHPAPGRRPMTTASAAARPHAFALLLDRYVSESLGDAAFSAVCDLTDDADATPAERLAFARFYLDVLAAGETDIALPKADEIADVLRIARA